MIKLPWIKTLSEPKMIVVKEDDFNRLVHVAYCYEATLKDLHEVTLRIKKNIDKMASKIEDKEERFLFEFQGSWLNNCVIKRNLRDLEEIKKGAFGLNWYQKKKENIDNLLQGFVKVASHVFSRKV